MNGVDRFWLVTSTTYGQWLPGDPRGSVSRENTKGHSHRKAQNEVGTLPSRPMAKLEEAARLSMKGDPVFLTTKHVERLFLQFLETCAIRKWVLIAAAIMANHFHAIVGVPGDPDPDGIVRDLKAYASRALNEEFGKPESGTWWTLGASKRKLPNEVAVLTAVKYLRDQEYPLLIWIHPVVETW